MRSGKKLLAGAMTAAATGAAVIGISVSSASSGHLATAATPTAAANAAKTTTPIKHVVVLYDENVSFDHYFGTYPYAENRPGEPPFHAKPNTPSVNGLNNTLLTANPNLNNPQRLSPDQALTCDQNHAYTPEQSAFDGGLMDKFVQDTTGGGCTETTNPDNGSYGPNGIVMDYYDGNTVTGLWNYAQNYVLNDNSYGTQFGPSTPGALDVISGTTHGGEAEGGTSTSVVNGTINNDIDPYYDECSNSSATPTIPGTGGRVTAKMTGQNIGDLLNTKSVTWGWFYGGFTPSSYKGTGADAQPVCGTTHNNIGNSPETDYSPHRNPFAYYQSTSNPYHLSPSSVHQVGTSEPTGVNHEYDLSWFNKAVKNNDMPAVSFLKAPVYEDGHAGTSDPLDEQRFVVDEINLIEQSKDWSSTAIFITYDDSDGWYDHQMGPIIRGSQDAADTLNGPGKCGSPSISDAATTDRCGVGPRVPMLVISPWAKQNYVDNTFTEQASIPKFIEDNWSLGRIGNGSADAAAGSLMNAFNFNQSYGHAPEVILNPDTGEVEKTIYPASSTAPPSTTASSPTSTTTSTSMTTPTSRGSGPGTPSGPTTGGSTHGGGHARGRKSATVRLPRLSYKEKFSKHGVAVTFTTKGGAKVPTRLRLRLYRGKSLIANKAARVRNHKAKFHIALAKNKSHAGRYRFVVSIDAGGKVGKFTRSVRVRN